MKLKEKFDSIDQSKLNSEQKDFLSKIEKATKNFTSDNKEVNDKVEGALDKMIATFKEKMPEAIKTKAEKKQPKSIAKKATSKSSEKPSRTNNGKRSVMSVAKEIRKDGESWVDAQKRARAEMKKDKESATKEVKTEMEKLLAFIKTRKELEGISGTDLKRDSSREAKPRGRRISKDGNVYYENRENRIDRLAPNYPKDAPMLKRGGSLKNRYEVVKVIGFDKNGNNLPKNQLKVMGDFDTKREAIEFAYQLEMKRDVTQRDVFVRDTKLNKEIYADGGAVEEIYFFQCDSKEIRDDFYEDLQAYMPDHYKSKMGDLGIQLNASPNDEEVLQQMANSTDGVFLVVEKYEKGGYVAVTETKDDYWVIVSRPTSKKMAEEMAKLVTTQKDEKNKVVTLAQAKAHKKVLGKEYLDKFELGGNTNIYKVGQKFYDTRYDRVSEIVPSSNDALITFVRYNKSGTEMDMSTKQSLIKNQFDYLVNMGAYQFRNYELGGTIVTDLAGHTGGSLGGDPTLLSGVTGTQYSGLVGETGAMSSGEMFENGGTVVVDLAGHTGAGDGGLNANMPLDGFSNTSYSGLVGETGTMSSGEMFENGGGVEKNDDDEDDDEDDDCDDKYKKGGALARDRKFYNHSQKHEVRYSRNKSNRHGYGNLRFDDGGYLTDPNFGDFQAGVYAEGGSIPNNYDGKYYGDIWDKEWTNEQKYHFLSDHKNEIGFDEEMYNESSLKRATKRMKSSQGNDVGFQLIDSEKLVKTKSSELPRYVYLAFQKHIREGQYAEGGSLENHGIKEGDTFVKTIAGNIQKVKDKDGKIVFINLATGERDSQPPLPFADGGKVTYFVNKDGVKVRSVAKPDKELSEKEWMAKHSESKEARTYAGGGSLEDEIKKKLNKNFSLPLEVAVYVPSTKDADEFISEDEFEDRVESVQKYLSNLFGGFSANDVDGGYMSQEKGLITEEVYKVISFAQRDGFSSKMEKLVAQVKKWAKDWGQESIGLEFEGDLFYIDQKGNYAEGGEINAFSMRMVKGTNSKPDEVLTQSQEVKFAGGGQVKKRQAYLDTLADKESDIWDKLGAESGADIRQDKDMLRNYALKMEAMLKREEVGKGSFDEADYDHFQDMNAHLMNEFLVWNNYYEPEMTVREKKWRTEKFPDSKYRNYVSDPKVISLSDSNTDKADKYIVHADIKFVTVEKNGKELKFKGSDVLNGANILKNGGEISESATYYPKRSIVSVELKDGKKIKPSNGYWIKKNASEIKVEKEYKVKSNVGIFPKKGTQTYWYVENSKGQTINRHTDKPYRGKEMDNYIFYTERNAESFAQRLNMSSSFETGGKVSFAEKSRAIAKNFEGKRVEPKYQKEYGKTYDKAEAKEVGNKIAGAQKAKYDAKAEKGAIVKKKSNNPNAGQSMLLAKKIRKDGEKWTDAVKRASAMLKAKK